MDRAFSIPVGSDVYRRSSASGCHQSTRAHGIGQVLSAVRATGWTLTAKADAADAGSTKGMQ